MTIKIRIVGAFSVVLAVLIILCGNTHNTLATIDREAIDVELRNLRTTALADFNGQAKLTVGLVKQFTLSEKTSDHDLLATALAKLREAAGRLDQHLFPRENIEAVALRQGADAFMSGVDAMIALAKARQKCSADVNDTITDLQVTASAIAGHAVAIPDLAHDATGLIDGTGSSAIAALRYRFSRDPADIGAARRWLDIAGAHFKALTQASGQDRHQARINDSFADTVHHYRLDLDDLEAVTTSFAAASKNWDAGAARLLSNGLAARLEHAAAQRASIGRTRSAIAVANRFDLTLGISAVIVALILAGLLVRTIASPLVSITEAMRRIAAGELETAIAGVGRHDEIGRMAAAVEVFRTGLLRVKALDEEKKDEQLKKQQRIARMMALNRTFETEVGAHTSSLSHAATAMMEAAEDLLRIAAQTSSRSCIVASAATSASSNVRLVAGGTEELSHSLRNISGEVSTSTMTAGEAVRRAQEADCNVQALMQGASKIGEVVGLIRSIAHDTNLLALNATIEAARAGASGRGFGVVAEEVKQLAVATAKATDEVGQLIKSIQQAMQAAAATIQDIKSSIGAMDRNACQIAIAVEEQSISIARITSSATGAATGTEQVTQNIVDVMAASRMTDTAARQVLTSAESVAQRTRSMNEKVASFLSEAMAV